VQTAALLLLLPLLADCRPGHLLAVLLLLLQAAQV
jgi:hypothetical protein